MKLQARKAISLLLVLVQIFVLFPVMTLQAQAAGETDGETPILNPLKVGNLKFQAFNFLGENTTGDGANDYSDGIDYTSTFYYTDDYFSPSAINEAADDTTMLWSDLDNTHLAACSAAFAFASFTSNEGNVTSNTKASGKGSWENTDYTNKDSNIKSFLTQCGFAEDDITCYGLTEKPTISSIGYTIGSKEITVWDAESQRNKTYTLVAVGVRGAGYDSEWADNVTIGNPNTSAHEMPNGRHWGFDNAANTVCSSIQAYLQSKNITGDVKYWVTGFSRAAAVANLVAGYLSDSPSTYHTSNRKTTGNPDVYGYTWECPQGASVNEPALNYKNIHNIVNPMDMVPKVSPDEFEHQRLGVDYQMPYHGNTNSGSQNTQYYNQMWKVIQTIIRTDDPLYKAVNPNNYPYNSPITPYTITPTQLLADAGEDGKLAENFGTVLSDPTYTYQEKHTIFGFTYYTTETYNGNVKSMLGDETGDRVCDWYMDDFIDNLIDVFLASGAWDRNYSNTTTDAVTHRNRFIETYQPHFRNVLGYMLDYSGPAFLGLVTQLIDAVGEQLSLSNLLDNGGLALAFTNFYAYPTSTYQLGVPPFIDGWLGNPLWIGSTRKDVLISEAQPVVKNVIHNMIPAGYDGQNGSGITQSQFDASMDYLVELVVDLYADELTKYSSQYFGTSLHFLNELLCTHLQETVLSWIMSLDSNHMNRSCRTITVPRSSNVKLLEFRPEYTQYDGDPEDADAAAPVVAEWSDGTLTTKDERITSGASGSTDYVVIRYPASLNIRVDITASTDLNLSNLGVDDYQTASAEVNVSAGETQYQGVPSRTSAGQSGFNYVTTNATESNASATNTLINGFGSLEVGDTLHVIANSIEKYDDTMTYDLLIDEAPKSVVTEYSMPTVVAEGVSQDAIPADAEGFAVQNGNLVWTGAVGTDNSRQYESVFSSYTFKEYQLSGLSETRGVTTDGPVRGIRVRQSITVVPAGNVYYDDALLNEPADVVNGVQDYKANVESALPTEIETTAENKLSFRFTGTRIDVYMNTDSNTGKVGVYLLNEDGTALYRQDGKTFSKIIDGKSEGALYNVPVVSFSGLNHGTYTLTLIPNKTSTVQIDGVRVYDETRASYASVRDALLSTADWTGDGEVSGTVYLDYEQAETAVRSTYDTSGPKGEVYLRNGNGVAFAIDGYNASANYRIGMSTVNGSTISVDINNKLYTVSSATHMFYDLYPTEEGFVVIRNFGGGILSVTDIEEVLPATVGSARKLSFSASPGLMLFARSLSAVPVETSVPEETPAPVETALPEETTSPTEEPATAQTPEPTPSPTPAATPTPTPTTPSSASSAIQIISSFVKSLFGGFSRLFRP